MKWPHNKNTYNVKRNNAVDRRLFFRLKHVFFSQRFFQSQPDNLKTDEFQQEVGVKFALVMYANNTTSTYKIRLTCNCIEYHI